MRARPILAALITLAACGGTSVPTLDTGLPRETPANEVTPSEAQAACQRYEDVANEALGTDVQQQVACTVSGIVSQYSGGASCSTTLATCMAQAPTNAAPVDFDCETAVTFAPSGCTATIGELEDCVNAVAAGIDHFTASLNCGLVGHPDRWAAVISDATTVAVPTTYEACQSLSAECLGLLGWADTTLPPVTGP